MLGNIFRLELKKLRRDAVGLLLLLPMPVVIAFGGAAAGSWSFANARVAAIAFTAIGLPATGIILCIQAAHRLRSEREKPIEEVFPVHPFTRVSGAYLACLCVYLAQLAASAIILTFDAFQTWHDLTALPDQFLWKFIIPSRFVWVLLHLLCAHFITFTFAFWIRQPLIAAMLAGVAMSALNAVSNTFGRPQTIYSLGLTSAGSVIVLLVCAKRFYGSQRIGLIRNIILGTLMVLCLSIAPIYSITRNVLYYHAELKKLRIQYYTLDIIPGSPLQEGMLAETGMGTLVRVYSDGRRQFVHENPVPSVTQLVLYILHAPYTDSSVSAEAIDSLFIDSDGSLWACTAGSSNSPDKIWHAPPGKAMSIYKILPAQDVRVTEVSRIGSHLILYGDDLKGEDMWTLLSSVRWQRWDESIITPELDTLIKDGSIVTVSQDRRSVVQEFSDGSHKEWKITTGPPSYIQTVHRKNLNGSFEGVMETEDGVHRDVLFLANGSIQIPGHTWWIPGGGVMWGSRDVQTVMDRNGALFRPIDGSALCRSQDILASRVLRLEDSSLWLHCRDGPLLEINLLNGKVVHSFDLPGATAEFYEVPTKEGVYYIDNARIWWMDWNGRKHDLGPAKLEG